MHPGSKEKAPHHFRAGPGAHVVGLMKMPVGFMNMCTLRKRIEADAAKVARKQKLNACLQKRSLPEVSLVNGATERWVRNAVGFSLNRLIDELLAEPMPPVVILEKLSVRDMRFKSREQNRLLKAGQ